MSNLNSHCFLSSLDVCCDKAAQQIKAQRLAQELKLSFAAAHKDKNQLAVTEHHIQLRIPELGKPIWIDFLSGKNAHRRKFGGGKGQTLAKALSLKNNKQPTVVDATAGFGRDAFVMATLGCHVTMIERNPIIACLLQDALARGLADEEDSDLFQAMRLVNSDASDYLQSNTEERPDIIYLDPMFPSRSKSAMVKKEMQLLHKLVGQDMDSDHLLAVARESALKRVVVKRPKSAEPISRSTPNTSIASKNTRYDIYLC